MSKRIDNLSPDPLTRRLFGKAIAGYDLIQDRDRIAVAVSGGKDSLTLLWLLRERLRRIPIRYDILAIYIDLGFDPSAPKLLEDFFQYNGFSYRIVRTCYGVQAHSPDNRENPCFWCARMRRATLFQEAVRHGCNKLALGHNQDDFIETFFINLFYGGQLAGMLPKQPFFDGKITVIRPLALLSSERIRKLHRRLNLPIISNPCPSSKSSKRAEIRQLLKPIFMSNPKLRDSIYHAISRVNLDYIPQPLKSNSGVKSAHTQAVSGKDTNHANRKKRR